MKRLTRVMLVTHFRVTGQPVILIEFIRRRVLELLVLRHPFSHAKDIASRIEFYKDSIKIKEKKFLPIRAPDIFLFLKDFILTLFTALKFKRKFDLFIGADCLNAFSGTLLRTMRLVTKVVLYTIDLPPKRFDNSVLNMLYHRLNVYCAEHCDFIWDLSPRMEVVRKRFGWKPKKGITRLVVPTTYKPMLTSASYSINREKMVFVGHLKKSQGLQLVISAFPKILKEVPNAELLVIGTGPYEGELRKMVQELGLKDVIEFLGYIKNHQDIEKILLEGGIGIAPYMPDPEGITTYADPMKPKAYMACGLPVIITDVPLVSLLIRRREAGIVIKYAEEDFVEAALKFMMDHRFYLHCRANALALASEYFPERVFSKALAETLASF